MAAVGDANMRALQKGDVLQLERKGYFIVDEPLARLGRPAVLFAIPDGKPRPIIAPPDPSYYPGAAPAAPNLASANGGATASAAKGVSHPAGNASPAADPTAVAAGMKAAAGAAVVAAQAAGAAVAGSAAAAAGGMRRLLHPEGGDVGLTPSPTPQPSGDLRAQM